MCHVFIVVLTNLRRKFILFYVLFVCIMYITIKSRKMGQLNKTVNRKFEFHIEQLLKIILAKTQRKFI